MLYNEVFSWLATYGGAAIKFKEDGHFGIDINLGFIFISGGNDSFLDKYEEEKTKLENQGWTFTDEIVSVNSIKFSIGLLYFF